MPCCECTRAAHVMGGGQRMWCRAVCTALHSLQREAVVMTIGDSSRGEGAPCRWLVEACFPRGALEGVAAL
jgi:hypothetical protein